jgi:hypothetical protein
LIYEALRKIERTVESDENKTTVHLMLKDEEQKVRAALMHAASMVGSFSKYNDELSDKTKEQIQLITTRFTSESKPYEGRKDGIENLYEDLDKLHILLTVGAAEHAAQSMAALYAFEIERMKEKAETNPAKKAECATLFEAYEDSSLAYSKVKALDDAKKRGESIESDEPLAYEMRHYERAERLRNERAAEFSQQESHQRKGRA